MCGIVGYVGKKQAIPVLISGLEALEYRGYDSAGIALLNPDEIRIIKSVGKIEKLKKKVNKEKLGDYHIGIAHTRWATHGKADEINAHPHQVGRITLIHNGIIENAYELKEELIKEGVTFKSDTDTEVVAALIDKYLKEDIVKTLEKVKTILVGSYALGIIVDGKKDKLYIVKKDSPLVIGIGEEENFFASDITAINTHTNRFIFLDELEVAEISEKEIMVYNDMGIVDKKVDVINTEDSSKSKNGYPHYMLKEIYEQPIVLGKTLNPYLENLDLLPDLTAYEEIHIVACGSAMYAGMIGKILLEEKAEVKTVVDVASEYRYKKNIYNNKTLVILVSQSGETADTIAAMRKAKENGQDTLAIVNVKTSTIAREADRALFIEAGEEIAVATTKAYLLQVAMLSLLSLKLAYDKKLITNIDEQLKEFKVVPEQVKEIIERRDQYKRVAIEIYKNDHAFFLGRKLDFAMTMEGSLKLKEISYIHSEAYQAGELKHGTISLIDKDTPVIAVITDKELKEKTMSNVIEVKSRGAKCILITTEDLKQGFELEILVKPVNMFLQALLIVPILQLIAYDIAVLRGCDIDKPRNLAKSVTVE